MSFNPLKLDVSNVMSKAAGAAGLALIAVDSHHAAKETSRREGRNKATQSLQERYFDTLSLSSPSKVQDSIKKGIFFFDMDNNIDSFFHSIGGYVKGFSEMVTQNIVPFALSAGALLGPKFLSKTCGLGLAVYGSAFLAQEIFRIGK